MRFGVNSINDDGAKPDASRHRCVQSGLDAFELHVDGLT